MRKLFVPMLIVVILIQFVLLRLGRDDSSVYPRIWVQDGVYVVEMLDEAMEDDSVRAVKYRLELVADEFGQWYIDQQSSTWACWPERWHEDFGNELCE